MIILKIIANYHIECPLYTGNATLPTACVSRSVPLARYGRH